ncbi:MAG: SIP domain-containing protein [Neisseriaceae bacterium]|nr:SIP domain-containing protein [Neisseriaceae bacterium]
MTNKKYTPIENVDKKIDVIDHINDDHLSEVLSIARGYTEFKNISTAKLMDIFEEGMLISVTAEAGTQEAFIPFLLKGDLEENVLYLAYNAMVKLGESPISNKKQYFEVLETLMVSPNMIRLIVKSALNLPFDQPGYAYLLSLSKLEAMPQRIKQDSEKLSKLKQWLYKLFLWRVRKMSSQDRLERMLAFAKDTRYYTLRAARKSQPGQEQYDIGDIDIFIHGDTPGGLWAKSLNPGDIIRSISETPERCDHLNEGQTLLIADETSLPTVLALLENWQNPISPYIISITRDEADQAYLPDALVAAPEKLIRLPAQDISATVIKHLQDMPQIDSAWGAIENLEARAIRKYLRDERGLSGRHNRVKAYWSKA